MLIPRRAPHLSSKSLTLRELQTWGTQMWCAKVNSGQHNIVSLRQKNQDNTISSAWEWFFGQYNIVSLRMEFSDSAILSAWNGFFGQYNIVSQRKKSCWALLFTAPLILMRNPAGFACFPAPAELRLLMRMRFLLRSQISEWTLPAYKQAWRWQCSFWNRLWIVSAEQQIS